MITTIDHSKLSLNQVCQAQLHFSEIAYKIEKKLRLAPGYRITLYISDVLLCKRLEIPHHPAMKFVPKFELFLVTECEIISFERSAAVATRIVAGFGHFFISRNGKHTFHMDNDQRVLAADTVVKMVTSSFRKALREAT